MNEQIKLPDGSLVGTGMNLPQPGRFVKSVRFDKSWLLDDDQIEYLMQYQNFQEIRKIFRKYQINQGSIGSCNAAAAVGATYRTAFRVGFEHVPLSENDLYIQINGGQDQGSLLADAFNTFRDVGCSPRVLDAGTYPYQAYLKRQVPNAAYREGEGKRDTYRTHEPVKIPTDDDFDRAIATCMARGWPVIMAWHVGRNSNKLRNGYVVQSRGWGNHASFIHGGKWVGGQDLVHPNLVNSWTSFDPMYGRVGSMWGEDGNGLMTMESLAQCRKHHDFYAITSIKDYENDDT